MHMMFFLLSLWSSVIPSLPLTLPHAGAMSCGTFGLLLVCAVALWFERDRQAQPKPVHFDRDERLAA
jgi:hypothetical protein